MHGGNTVKTSNIYQLAQAVQNAVRISGVSAVHILYV
jgi:hypothetical protein